MESAKKRSDDRVILLILAVYFLPAILLTFLSGSALSDAPSFTVFAVGFLFAAVGSILLLVAFQKRPKEIVEKRERHELAAIEPKFQVEDPRLREELEAVKAEWFEEKEKCEHLLIRCQKAEEELHHYQSQTSEQIRKKELLLSEYTKTVEELYRKMEEKQAEISKLEGSVSDLTYDLDTLIKLSKSDEREPTPHKVEAIPLIRSEKDAEQLLKRCMNTLQKFTSNYYAHPGEHSALDQRRLYDSFRSEQAAIVFLYSLKEGTMLFVSDSSKAHLGWNAEHFAHDFFDLVAEGVEEFRASISSLAMRGFGAMHLLIHTREGQDLLMQCRLAMIPTGVFKHQAVGILYRISS